MTQTIEAGTNLSDSVGRSAWMTMDLMAAVFQTNYKNRPQEMREVVRIFFETLREVYPCDECRAHLNTIYTGTLQPQFNLELLTPESFLQMIYTLHDRVNVLLMQDQTRKLDLYVKSLNLDDSKKGIRTYTETLQQALNNKWLHTWKSIPLEAYRAKITYVQYDPRASIDAAWQFCEYIIKIDNYIAERLVRLILIDIIGLPSLPRKWKDLRELRVNYRLAKTESVVAKLFSDRTPPNELTGKFVSQFSDGNLPW